MTTTTVTPVYAWNEARPFIGKCARCATTLTVERTLDQHGEAHNQARCACGAWVIMAFLDARYGKRECGDWCTEGTGRKCTCTCGGSQHGLAWRVK